MCARRPPNTNALIGTHDVLFVTLDTLRYDVARDALRQGRTPNLAAVLPGGVATEIFQGLPDAVRAAEEARFANQPLPRIGEPSEVAQAYLYLMKCGYPTGQIIKVDGGGELGG